MKKKSRTQLGIRGKLLLIFILIKVIPLLILAVFATKQITGLGVTVKNDYSGMISETRELVTQIGDLSTENSINALDIKSREAIERLTTDTAMAVASFLYQRDNDITFASKLSPDKTTYSDFLTSKKRKVVGHKQWIINSKKDGWVPVDTKVNVNNSQVRPIARDNEKEFHYRHPGEDGVVGEKALYLEMTFVDLDGQERIKVTTSDVLPGSLQDVSKKENTWCRAETYFKELQNLENNETYVSEVIGAYVSSPVIGRYTPERTKKLGISFEPEKAGYAGKENPVGKKFQGIVRWAAPVLVDGKRIGYVTLALDHTHIMEFTDHIVPTRERYSVISDASTGNYAFMWDYHGKNISHPRDYFIVGYDPETGEPAVPWLSNELYKSWQESGSKYSDFQKTAPLFNSQSLSQKPSVELIKQGSLALDCRYLNFAPQCTGWHNLTQYGGSGSFVIFWSKLWKLTTAATIPYYTGRYEASPRGFGYVTIGANVHEFHSAASETAQQITALKSEYGRNLERKGRKTLTNVSKLLENTNNKLIISTLIMVVLVMFIAVWMASTLTGKILEIIRGIRHFQSGELEHRLEVKSDDEMGQLAKALNEMSDEIQDSIYQINKARQRAEGSDKAKGLFLANMSHEIRTPMNAIIGMSRLALRCAEDEKQRHLLETVKDSADSLLSLINDILDFSKVEAGQLAIESHLFDLHDFINSTVQSIVILAEKKDLDLSCSIEQSVPNFARGDGLRLRQVLLNLLSNAVKFTEKGSIIVNVDSSSAGENKMRLKVVVEDSGIGIPREMKEAVFGSFSQVDSSLSREYQGSGLGLAITRKLCQLMGGDVNVDCIEGKGCTFVFTVVLEYAEPIDLLIESSSGLKNKPRIQHILLVEDNPANRDLARMILEGEGHSVVEAVNGMEALSVLADESFNIILMDIQMPKMDGLVATKIIRALEKGEGLQKELGDNLTLSLRKRLEGKHHPIIALTAHAMSGDREKCMAAGVDTYLTKPFIPEQIVAVLNEVGR